MHHFVVGSLAAMLNEAGFTDVRSGPVQDVIYVFEAAKAAS